MSGTPRRLVGRGLLLILGTAAAGLAGALIRLGLPNAEAATVPSPSPSASPTPGNAANPLGPLLTPVTQTVEALVPAVQGLVSSITAPVLGPVVSHADGTHLGRVVSQLGGMPLGGALSPPPVPIQITPVTGLVTGLLPVGSRAPLVAEPTGAAPAPQPQLATSPTGSGSVPVQPLPTPAPFPLSPAAPAAPAVPLPPSLPAPSAVGSLNPSGSQLRGGIETEVPTPSPATHPTASRAPPVADSSIRRLIADEPSFSPD